MDIDIYLYLRGKEFCRRKNFGLMTEKELLPNLYDAILRKRINEAYACDAGKVNTPSINCPEDVTLIDEEDLIIGETTTDQMTYGYYLFDTPKTTTLTFGVVNTDLATYPANYTTSDTLDTTITLNGSALYFPAILVPNNVAIKIYDKVNADITHTFSTYTDGSDTWYVQEQVVMEGVDIEFRIDVL